MLRRTVPSEFRRGATTFKPTFHLAPHGSTESSRTTRVDPDRLIKPKSRPKNDGRTVLRLCHGLTSHVALTAKITEQMFNTTYSKAN